MDYEKILSPVVTAIPPSGIRKLFNVVNEMEDVVSLGVGEPDFNTPQSIKNAGIRSLELGYTHYTANAGIKELREEITVYLNRKYNLSYDSEDVFVTVGGSEAIDAALRTVVVPGDEVLIPEPSFVCYKPLTALAGGVPVPIVTKEEDNFRLTKQQLESAITPKTKALILPYPNNPTGAVMSKKDLEAIAEVIRGTNIIIISDEIYSELNYTPEGHTSIIEIEGMKERTILINGFSKTFAMTGWRLGYACGPKEIIQPMIKVHQFAIMSSPTTSQYAAVEALRSCDNEVNVMKNEYNMRRRLMLAGLRSMGLSCFEPLGAFYLFPNITKTGFSSDEFCERLLKEERVAVVSGNAFGVSGEGFIRCSYAYSVTNINKALERIGRFVKKYI
ncbi:MAG: aminotransferase class I/II-fold pyridoxal phosphate-dependent enzyme [Bacillota bacterium]|nr:aminotransferase class I/II-fold pyridoxal phosphate-dependent enzyme [Bacillota bacterium]